MPNNETAETAARESTDNAAEYLYKVADTSYKLEADRYESLSSLATRLLTAISILSVAIMSLLALVSAPLFANGLAVPLVTFACIAFASLLVAFGLALCSQIRFRYKTLANPADYADAVGEYKEDYPSRTMAARKYAEEFKNVFATTRHRNNRIMRMLTASMICVGIALLIVLIAAIVLVSAATAIGIIS